MSTATLRSATRNSIGSSTATASASLALNSPAAQRRIGTMAGWAFTTRPDFFREQLLVARERCNPGCRSTVHARRAGGGDSLPASESEDFPERSEQEKPGRKNAP